MPGPVILGFNTGDSLLSSNSVSLGAGYTWGSVTAPLRALEFTEANMRNVYGNTENWTTYLGSFNVERFYWNSYNSLASRYRSQFWGGPHQIEKRIRGVNLGINDNGVLNEGADLVSAAFRAIEERAFRSFLRRIFSTLAASVSADATQTSQSLECLMYGMNGRNTYAMDINQFTPSMNICVLQASASAIVQAAINLVIVGNFPSLPAMNGFFIPSLYTYLRTVWSHGLAYGFVGDAAAGFILPGAQLSIVGT